MALPSSGEITFAQVNLHLKRAETAAINLNDAQVRGLAGKASGAIAMSDLHGKWAGEKMVCGVSGGYYGFSNGASDTVTAAKIGSLTGLNIFARVPKEVVWSGGSIFIWLEPGETAPTSTQLIIRDANFGAVATVAISPSSWSELGGLVNTATLTTNPFPSGATRWLTWN